MIGAQGSAASPRRGSKPARTSQQCNSTLGAPSPAAATLWRGPGLRFCHASKIGPRSRGRGTKSGFRPTDRGQFRPLHVFYDVVPELGAFDLGGSGRQSSEIVGNPFARNRAVQALQDQISRFGPA